MTEHPTFTPTAMSPEDLDSITVGREALFDTLVRRIRGAASDGARPHTLLVAPRGGGKTHTLHVAVNRSLADPQTAEHVLPVLIPEDSLAIGSYLDLLVEIARTIDVELGVAARGMRRDKDTVGIEQAIMTTAAGRMILLAIENLDRVFDELGETGQGSLRAWVETSTDITVFATAPALFSGVSSRSYPWYGSFMVETLPELSIDEGATMLGRTARRRGDMELAEFIDSPTGLERLQVIHRLAGGSPRLWHILSDCIDVRSLDALVPTVEALLDRLAPYYQQRLWQLPPGEQRLVVELARGWEPQKVGDLAAAVGVSSQSAATALGRLTASRWVTSTKARDGDQRASWYDVTEPLLRYHLQYREERGKPLRLIVEFLRGFYSRERLLGELAEATPGSHAERHLQQALYDASTWLAAGSVLKPRELLASLRLWMLEGRGEFSDISAVLEAILTAAQGNPVTRALPPSLNELVADALAAQVPHERFRDRVTASLSALRQQEWSADADDAISVFEFLCSVDGEASAFTLTADCAALRERRTSPPAVVLRTFWAFALLRDDGPDIALEYISQVLDDIDGESRVSDGDRSFLWSMWLEAVSQTSAPPRQQKGTVDAGWVLLTALQTGRIRIADFDRLMAAFTAETQSTVAAVVAMGAPQIGVDFPPDQDPRLYVDDELRGVVDQFVAEHTNETAARS